MMAPDITEQCSKTLNTGQSTNKCLRRLLSRLLLLVVNSVYNNCIYIFPSGLTGKIISAICSKGFEISALQMVRK